MISNKILCGISYMLSGGAACLCIMYGIDYACLCAMGDDGTGAATASAGASLLLSGVSLGAFLFAANQLKGH